MTNDSDKSFFDFARFLKEKGDEAFHEVDGACLSPELFANPECQKSIQPLYFFLTRRGESGMTVREMKKTFKCGGCLIQQVRKAIREKKPLKVPGHKHINPIRDDPSLVGLVDTITGDNGAVSDGDLANLLGTSRSSVNRIRHDLKYAYRPLRHGPLLQDRQIEARLAFCRAHLNDDWSTTMFTDESRFATSPDCPVKSWTKRGQNAYIESQKFPASFMV